jgi:hypothetical protein
MRAAAAPAVGSLASEPPAMARSSRLTRTSCRWYGALLFGLCLCVLDRSASAHELAMDQVMLWPDPAAGVLRGELTFDPELTRSKDAQPSAEDERRVLAFLEASVRLMLDGEAQRLGFEVRELWVRGGATLGDVVVFTLPLPTGARELRLFASDAFGALVTSVQRVGAAGGVETTSWLLRGGEWTPVYHLGAGWQQPGWRAGGPDVFSDAVSSGAPATGARASDRPSEASAAPPASLALAARFIRVGFEHILPGGIDHVLFVAGLVLGSARRYRQVLISLTLFTLAHTLTLALANFQVVRLPAGVVEPLIALSIVVLGVDNLRRRVTSAPRRPPARHALVFGFGLIHGLGFANALAELAFDPRRAVLALFSFNLGVELGQVVVVVLLGLVLHLIRERGSLERYATLAGSALIALCGSFLVFERLAPVFAAPPTMSTANGSTTNESTTNGSKTDGSKIDGSKTESIIHAT